MATILEPVELRPAYIRLPRDNERDPLCGLSRTQLKLAIKNGDVKSVALKKTGKNRGCRLIEVSSLLRWVSSQAA